MKMTWLFYFFFFKKIVKVKQSDHIFSNSMSWRFDCKFKQNLATLS